MSLYVDVEKALGSFRLSANFEAEDEVLGILGASGCGKSVTLECIAGVMRPDRGRIILDGTTLFDSEKNIDLPPQKRRVGLLFQSYGLFPNMTVEQNLMTGLRASGVGRKKAKEETAEMIRRFYLEGLEKLRPFQLSGGQQQRTALARILLTKPRLLMLDEPFSALDGYLRWKVEMELTDIIKEFGSTTLFVSHSRDEIYRICRKACVMDHGKTTAAVPVKTMFEEPKTLAACLLSGCKNYSVASPVREEKGQEEAGTWIDAKDWGVRLDCGRRVPENITCVGVRSHYIRVLSGEESTERPNVIECRICRIVEDVFNMVVMVSPLKAPSDSHGSRLRLEMPKEQWEACAREGRRDVGDEIRIWIEPRNLLMLG